MIIEIGENLKTVLLALAVVLALLVGAYFMYKMSKPQ